MTVTDINNGLFSSVFVAFCVLGRVMGREMDFFKKSAIVFLDMKHGIICSTLQGGCANMSKYHHGTDYHLIQSMYYNIATFLL